MREKDRTTAMVKRNIPIFFRVSTPSKVKVLKRLKSNILTRDVRSKKLLRFLKILLDKYKLFC